MPTIVKLKKNNIVYLYHQTKSYRDENGKPQNIRKCVGKIDSTTGIEVFHPWFLAEMQAAGTPLVEYENALVYSVSDLKNSRTVQFGLLDVLRKNALNIGLNAALKKSNPKYADEIFMLASHLVANGEPFIHTQEWLENSDVAEPVGNLSSRQISKILADISQNDIDGFFCEWSKLRSEREFLALDITSASSYSTLIDDVEWGYSRDGEDLPQINLCLLMGETSRLPIYQTEYAGSPRDVSTLKTTLAKFDAITEHKPICAVMDKGFCSKKNIDMMLAENKKFVIALSFSLAFAKRQVVENQGTIVDIDNAVRAGNSTLRAITTLKKWGKFKLYTHVFYNPVKAVIDTEKIVAKVTKPREIAENNPEEYISKKDYLKFLIFTKTDSKIEISINKQAVQDAKKHAGWLVIVSNHVDKNDEALRIYREKDVAEKGFWRLKNSIDLGRLRIHSDSAMQSKLFIGFVALVIMSHVHKVMCDNDFYKKYTIDFLHNPKYDIIIK